MIHQLAQLAHETRGALAAAVASGSVLAGEEVEAALGALLSGALGQERSTVVADAISTLSHAEQLDRLAKAVDWVAAEVESARLEDRKQSRVETEGAWNHVDVLRGVAALILRSIQAASIQRDGRSPFLSLEEGILLSHAPHLLKRAYGAPLDGTLRRLSAFAAGSCTPAGWSPSDSGEPDKT